MPDESFQDKTEPASPRKKEESRKKGQVGKSREISSIAVLSAGVLYLYFGAKDLTFKLGGMVTQVFSSIPQVPSIDNIPLELFYEFLQKYLLIFLPLALALCVVAVLGNALQTGIIWSVDPLTPKASKISPIQGIKRMFSLRSLVELAKSLLKIIIIGWVAVITVKGESDHILPLMYQESTQIISLLAHIALKIAVRCCCVIAILAILDYFYQKWEYEKGLRMTKQEVKDEFKQTEGDPMVKSRIRSIQREMAKRRMMEEVPKADVVITNPTRLAIALRYSLDQGMSAPMIVAKGANRVAAKIREIARQNDIPLVENKPLAQNLYKLEIGEEIPPEFYKAIAEILAYVYKLKNSGH